MSNATATATAPHVTIDSVLDTVPTVTPYNDRQRNSYTILRIKGTYFKHSVCAVPKGEFGRQEFQGPLVEGPWAATFGLSSCIHNGCPVEKEVQRRLDDARTIDVRDGTLLRIEGVTYVVSVERREYLKLTPAAEALQCSNPETGLFDR